MARISSKRVKLTTPDYESVWEHYLNYQSYSFPAFFNDYLKFLTFPALYTISQNILQIRVPLDIPAFTLTNITIRNLKNPDKEGGTPSVKVFTLCNQFLINSNEAFGQIGLVSKPLWLENVSLSVKSNTSSVMDAVAGALNSYSFRYVYCFTLYSMMKQMVFIFHCVSFFIFLEFLNVYTQNFF